MTSFPMLFFRRARSVRASSSGLSSTNRIMLFSMFPPEVISQSKVKRSALLDRSFRPHVAAVTAEDTLDGGQADPGARELTLSVQPLKGSEQMAGVARVESRSIVTNEIDLAAIAQFPAELDAGGIVGRGIFPGIVEEVLHHHLEQL